MPWSLRRQIYLRRRLNAIAWTTTGLENTPKVNESGKATHGHAMFKAEE